MPNPRVRNARVKPTVFVLLRHAEKLPGIGDLGLAPSGVEATQLLANTFIHQPPDAIYSSDLLRSKQTAEIIARRVSRQVEECAQLKERNVMPPPGGGTAGFKDEWAKMDRDRDYPSFGGESSRMCGERLRNALSSISTSSDASYVLCVTHGGIIRDFVINSIEQHNGTPVSGIRLSNDFPASDIAHLSATGVSLRAETFFLDFVGYVDTQIGKGVNSLVEHIR